MKNLIVYILDLAIENRHLGFGRFDSLALAVDQVWRECEQRREDNRRWRMIKRELDDLVAMGRREKAASSILDL